MNTSVPGSSRSTAASMSAALSTSRRAHPGRRSAALTGPLTSTTSAPASRAACATAKPIFPELRLLTKRTGSIALARRSGGDQHALAGERPAAAQAARSTRSASSSGSSMRPGPALAAGLVALAGPEDAHAALRSACATLARVAALAHIS